MTVITLRAIILGDLPDKKDLPNEEYWCIWAKKINGEWSPDSPALVTEYTPPENEFHMVGEFWNLNDLKDKYLANGQTLEQFADDWLASLNAAETVTFETFQKIRESHLSRK